MHRKFPGYVVYTFPAFLLQLKFNTANPGWLEFSLEQLVLLLYKLHLYTAIMKSPVWDTGFFNRGRIK